MRFLFSLLLLALLCAASATAQTMQAEPAFPRLTFEAPVDLQHAPGVDDRLYVVTQGGRIYTFENRSDVASSRLFLDLRDHGVVANGECGLLGLAFDPAFAQNGLFYCHYAFPDRSVVSRFSVDPQNRDSAISSSEKIIIEIPQPGASNHKGGQIAFGPDGYLYIALGDGGGGGDTFGTGQNLTTLLAKILRIDVHDTSAGRAYAIPEDNPFFGETDGRREEIFAYGFRNPWRFSFDPETGRLWAGDVGQDLYEEIDLVVNGANYGWPIMEGKACFRPSTGCDTTGLAMPVWDYPHFGPDTIKGFSVIGGHIYRGSRFPGLVGRYIYGDINGNIWALDYRPDGETTNYLLASIGLAITSFGVDADGELYMTVFGNPGSIYRLASAISGMHDDRTGIPATAIASTIGATQVTPLPSDDLITIEYHLLQRASVTLAITDALGREVSTTLAAAREPGTYGEPVVVENLAPGTYYYTITAGAERKTGRFLVR